MLEATFSQLERLYPGGQGKHRVLIDVESVSPDVKVIVQIYIAKRKDIWHSSRTLERLALFLYTGEELKTGILLACQELSDMGHPPAVDPHEALADLIPPGLT